MLKQRVIVALTGLVLIIAVAGASLVAADSEEPAVTPEPCACHVIGHGSGGGGGC